jgi:signal transduction histidine kinase
LARFYGVSVPLGLPLSGRFTARQLDLLVLGATLALSLPAIAHASRHGQLAIALAVLPFATLPLLWRREHPAAVLTVLAGALAVAVVVGRSAPGNVGVLFGLYAAALYGGSRLRLVTGAVVGAAALAAFAMLFVTDRARFSPHLSAAIVFGAGAAWVLGEVARTRRAYLAELEGRAVRLERERDEHARRATEEERIRIARELHDVVTHHVSVIAVQAGAAHSTSRERPERALEALGLIERTARSTLGELRALLGVLRAGDEPTPLAPLRPRPSIARLDELLAQARSAGIEVDAEVRGGPVPLDPVVELGAYRVLQEALTNVIKHAPDATAAVLVEYGARELRITVTDDGREPPGPNPSGHGLIGMHERVELAGGSLEAGPMAGGGFRVDARLPLNPVANETGAEEAVSA